VLSSSSDKEAAAATQVSLHFAMAVASVCPSWQTSGHSEAGLILRNPKGSLNSSGEILFLLRFGAFLEEEDSNIF
jgi:hypothetical protein